MNDKSAEGSRLLEPETKTERECVMSNEANLKAITRHMVALVGGPKMAAHICDVSEMQISYWCNDNHDRFIPLDHLMQLSNATGGEFLDLLARLSGHELIRKDVRTTVDKDHVLHFIGNFTRHVAAFSAEVIEAGSDGIYTPNECRRIFDTAVPVKDGMTQIERAIGG
ncbi:helix-turn-helix domain-containing protein [Bradyrhizobium elkanii]|uniref:helix-turn-helix domain-containing protein n=2 Tax=Bradyrhizobium elkanii TaxID=29448 RepID=UPI0021678F16|nr:helix-turn-helix domain-containing protein [Bradyrhizobium elkanii]MCS3690918.1 hypothetical protein [Bradyrhizobium elkanii]